MKIVFLLYLILKVKFGLNLKILGYKNLKDAIFNNNLGKKYKVKFENTLFINESGLYKILLSSNKKEATTFIEKITLEIIVPLGRIRSGQSPELCLKLEKKVNIFWKVLIRGN